VRGKMEMKESWDKSSEKSAFVFGKIIRKKTSERI
jgi:hypothetical protein